LWRDPDDVSHGRILSSDKTEWRLISATLCEWRRCFVATSYGWWHAYEKKKKITNFHLVLSAIDLRDIIDECQVCIPQLGHATGHRQLLAESQSCSQKALLCKLFHSWCSRCMDMIILEIFSPTYCKFLSLDQVKS